MAVLASGSLMAAQAQVGTVATEQGELAIEAVVEGLEHPWGMAFLPDGTFLVTERPGRLRLGTTEGKLSNPLSGTPRVLNKGQGGLLDVALHPDFEKNQLVYLSFAEPGSGGASTALGRGRFSEDHLSDFEVIFRQQPKVEGPNHFGGRIVFSDDDHLFLTLGERFKFEPAQDLSNHLGTIVRLRSDGSVPQDNPFVETDDAEDAIWSYGHRNIEAAAVQPGTGDLWIAEMGPLGGDELNRPAAGKNYGWPVVSWGDHYSGEEIPDPPTRPKFADAVKHWTPVISPSGMVFYFGDLFPEWRNDLLIGSLSRQSVVRLAMSGSGVAEQEIIPLSERIRDVEVGPDGVYLLTDKKNGSVWRMKPLQR